jgi:hypothetical protein
MNTKEFLSYLESNQDKELVFEYTNDKFVGKNYHITELKDVRFKTVDCGAKIHEWSENHLQLWESPEDLKSINYMEVSKVIDIINKVNTIMPLNWESELKIEFGSTSFPTSIMQISEIAISEKYLQIKLISEMPDCKASSICGVEVEPVVEKSSCCGSSTTCC